MKIFYILFFLLLSSIVISAQKVNDASEESKIEVIQIKWRRDVRNPELLKDPFSSIAAPNQVNYIADSQFRQQQNLPLEPIPSNFNFAETRRNASSESYIYKLKIKNNSNKTIKKVFWDYVFSESETNLLISRQRFQSFVNDGIKPGETKVLIMRSGFPPIRYINASRFRNKLVEQINIQKVE